MPPDPGRALGGAGLALGAAILVAGAAHSVAITATALEERGGLDARWMVLLSLGVTLMAGGAGLAASGWRALRGSRPALRFAGGAALFLWVHMAVVAFAFSFVPVVVYGIYLVAWLLLAPPLLRQPAAA